MASDVDEAEWPAAGDSCDLSGRGLTSFSRQSVPRGVSQGQLDRILILSLSGNRLTDFPLQLARVVPSLAHLGLAYNKIRGLPEDLGLPKSLLSLDLSFNDLVERPGASVQAVKRVALEGNPFEYASLAAVSLKVTFAAVDRAAPPQQKYFFPKFDEADPEERAVELTPAPRYHLEASLPGSVFFRSAEFEHPPPPAFAFELPAGAIALPEDPVARRDLLVRRGVTVVLVESIFYDREQLREIGEDGEAKRLDQSAAAGVDPKQRQKEKADRDKARAARAKEKEKERQLKEKEKLQKEKASKGAQVKGAAKKGAAAAQQEQQAEVPAMPELEPWPAKPDRVNIVGFANVPLVPTDRQVRLQPPQAMIDLHLSSPVFEVLATEPPKHRADPPIEPGYTLSFKVSHAHAK